MSFKPVSNLPLTRDYGPSGRNWIVSRTTGRWKIVRFQTAIVCFFTKCARWESKLSVLPSENCVLIYGGFLKWWYPTTIGFPTKHDHFGVFWGYHHLRKHPYVDDRQFLGPSRRIVGISWVILKRIQGT